MEVCIFFFKMTEIKAVNSISASAIPVGFLPGQLGAWTYRCFKLYQKVYKHKLFLKWLCFDYCCRDLWVWVTREFFY